MLKIKIPCYGGVTVSYASGSPSESSAKHYQCFHDHSLASSILPKSPEYTRIVSAATRSSRRVDINFSRRVPTQCMELGIQGAEISIGTAADDMGAAGLLGDIEIRDRGVFEMSNAASWERYHELDRLAVLDHFENLEPPPRDREVLDLPEVVALQKEFGRPSVLFSLAHEGTEYGFRDPINLVARQMNPAMPTSVLSHRRVQVFADYLMGPGGIEHVRPKCQRYLDLRRIGIDGFNAYRAEIGLQPVTAAESGPAVFRPNAAA